MSLNSARTAFLIHCVCLFWDVVNSQGGGEKGGFQVGYLPKLNIFKAAEALTPAQCSGSTIIHMGVGSCTAEKEEDFNMYVIPHAAIRHDGEICGTGSSTEYMIVVSSDAINDAQTANHNQLGPLYGVLSSNARARNAFKVLKGVDKVLVGFEYNGPRICGGQVAYEQNTIFMFVIPPGEGRDLNFGFAYLGVLEVGMVSIRTNEELCLYKETRRLGPGQAQFSTPTPSVTPNTNFFIQPELLILEDVDALPDCFPAKFVENAAKPSTSPSPTKRIPKPSPSSSPSGSIGGSATSSPIVSPSSVSNVSPSISPATPTSANPSPTPSISLGTSPVTSPSPSSEPICFPSEAMVELDTGAHVAIATLRIGDKVLVAKGVYSEVFMFSHNVMGPLAIFVELTLRSNRSLALSPKHYIPTRGRLTVAEAVQVGDTVLLGNGEVEEIRSTRRVTLRGLHNPQTFDGRIVVNGIVASTFTQHIDPPVALALLAPIKLLHRCILFRGLFSNLFIEGNRFFADLLPSGLARSCRI